MADSIDDFETRIGRISAQRGASRKGVRLHVDKNGLITARPRRSFVVPLRSLLLLLVVLTGFKVAALAQLGPQKYSENLTALAEGTIVEQAGAALLMPGPVTEFIARPLVRALR